MNVVVLSGGKGARLFPLSREAYPKQYLKLFGKSLFQMCIERAMSFAEKIFVVTNSEQKYIVEEQLAEMGVECEILVEPQSKNTLAAIIYGALEAGGTIAVMPSDHYIEGDIKRYFEIAKRYADSYIVTFGIKPRRPHTGYGYIKPGRKLGEVYEVERFVEKPDYETARRYVEEEYLWNSGMFVFDAELFIEECRRCLPGVIEAFERSVEEGYRAAPNTNVDKAVIERSRRVAVVPMDIVWSDLGSFDSIYEVLEKDANGNASKGEFLALNARRNLVVTDRLTALIGVEDVMVVSSDDALLVCRREMGEDVRKVVEILKARGDERVYHHSTVYRPWGSYTLLTRGDFYWVKRVLVKPGMAISEHEHYHRSEHWVVVRGTAKVKVAGNEYVLRSGESAFVPAGVPHRVENPGKLPLEMIEVAIGEYLEEDDIRVLGSENI